MDYDTLVNLIVEEIYKKINSEEFKRVSKPKAVVLWDDVSKFDLLKDEYEVLDFNKNIKDTDILIVSKLCMRGLSNLALGNSTSDEERFILKMLMKGRKVYILDEGIEYKRYKETAPKTLYKKYISYEDEIKTFGVEIVKDIRNITLNSKQDSKRLNLKDKDLEKEQEIVNLQEINSQLIIDEQSLDLRNKKLISESDLRKPAINGAKNVLVNKKSIVTPLAMDFMRIHRINLKKI